MPTLALPKNKIMQVTHKCSWIKQFLLLLIPIAIGMLLLTTTGCKKPTDNPPTGNNTTPTPCDTCLPPITTEGKGTFGCRINGKPFVAKGRSMSPATALDILGNYVSIAGRDFSDIQKPIRVSFSVDPLLDTGVIFFPNSLYDSWAQHSVGSNQFIAEDIIKGYIHFLRVDYQRRIFSGTFEFDVYSADGKDTIHITEGRFDVPH